MRKCMYDKERLCIDGDEGCAGRYEGMGNDGKLEKGCLRKPVKFLWAVEEKNEQSKKA